MILTQSIYSRVNPQQLVLRFDSATGFAKVGWAADLPVGRFVHIDIIGEAQNCEAFIHGDLPRGHPLYEAFRRACRRAREINKPLIAQQQEIYISKGFYPVPLDLKDPNATTVPDVFGIYQEAAMRALFRLTANFAMAWAVIDRQIISFLCSCRPPKPMQELEFQVWKHHTLSHLSQLPGEIMAGELIVQESGLWFHPQPDLDYVPPYFQSD